MMGLVRRLAMAAAIVGAAAGQGLAQVPEVIAEDGAGRTVLHALGETIVPFSPQRVVTLHNVFAEALLSMGIQPYGTVERPSGRPKHLAPLLEGTLKAGMHSDVDYEIVLGLEPDFILAMENQHADGYERLSTIAPTVLLSEPEAEWREWFGAMGEVLGAREAMDATIAAYDTRAAELKARLDVALGDQTVMLLRVRDRDVRLHGHVRRAGLVLEQDLGLNPHPYAPVGEHAVELSLENLGELTADHIFVINEDPGRLAEIEKNPLWARLPAVQAGHVYLVELEPWDQSTGPITFNVVLDDVEAALLGD